jgi:hypothetical protein
MSFLYADPKIATGLLPQTDADKPGWDIQFFVVTGVIVSILALFGYLIKTNVPAALTPPSDVPPAAVPPSIEAPASAPILPDHPAGSAESPRSDSVPLPRPHPTRRLNP